MRDGGGGPPSTTRPPEPTEGNGGDGAADFLYLVDRLEELVGVGKRVPFSTRVMIEEEDFLAIVDQLRATVPNDVRQAQRVIREREAIVAGAQAEAAKILEVARQQAEYIVSQQGVLNEARQRGEELLRQVEAEHRRSLGQIDQYALQQFTRVEDAVQQALQLVMDAVRDTTAEMEAAKRAIGG
jgi:vacuolar-type H+-ATPase subunit H